MVLIEFHLIYYIYIFLKGVVYYFRYHFLNITIGNGTETKIVLIKCLLDQLCFATQGDFLFLFICAYNDHKNIPAALNETKKTFVTTWIMDCAIWPLVNFLGFACIPYKLQPSYMSIVLFFWQLYMSSVATRSTNNITIQNDKKEEKTDSEESKLKYLFDKIDLKKVRMHACLFKCLFSSSLEYKIISKIMQIDDRY